MHTPQTVSDKVPVWKTTCAMTNNPLRKEAILPGGERTLFSQRAAKEETTKVQPNTVSITELHDGRAHDR